MKKLLKYTKKLNEKDLESLAKYLTTIPKNEFTSKKNND